MATIKLISESFVKPKYEIEAAKQPYYLGPVDLVFLSIDPIQKGLLFSLSSSQTSLANLLEKLKHSLSIALLHFYPLAGRFTTKKQPEQNTSFVFVDCNKGPGARFIHATALDLTVYDVLSPVDVSVAHSFFDLGEKYVNYDGHIKALLSIQLTELFDGVFIGFSMSHSVVDGTSFIHFVNMLSEIFRSNDYASEITKISRVPIFNYRPWDLQVIKFPFLDPEEFLSRGYDPGPLRERMFEFSPTSMARLKSKANQECGTNNVVISCFQALIALVWKSITRARDLPLDQKTTCFLAIGARGRLDPPVSDDYFDNILSYDQWSCKVGELFGNGLGWAAMKVRELIVAHTGKGILDGYKMFVNTPMVIPRGSDPDPVGAHGVIIGGSARFDMYGAEFGLGRALAARMGYGNKEDGKITANQGCEGGGSVELEICLRPHIMDALESDEEFISFVSLS
ncbi:uncharacterized acetyltransferase At3g50280-like [Spinacia oleracea]|uniref:Uncharacterized acetyltransferase At3g50280-like n=1 Tax=Spinacia oleracea TaxID=3562 RepID=A0A9R0IDP4_SPIOL|nr:uncharacterized acetyltransferase At3g50280-like [Spinacia oleracea]